MYLRFCEFFKGVVVYVQLGYDSNVPDSVFEFKKLINLNIRIKKK